VGSKVTVGATHEPFDFWSAPTQDISALIQLRQYFGGLDVVEPSAPQGLMVRTTNRAVEEVRVVKRDKLGRPLDGPPPPSVTLAEKRQILSDITHNKSLVLETSVATCRKKKQILFFTL
jgi:hypothetical protein